jgi:hypothetical protein
MASEADCANLKQTKPQLVIKSSESFLEINTEEISPN